MYYPKDNLLLLVFPEPGRSVPWEQLISLMPSDKRKSCSLSEIVLREDGQQEGSEDARVNTNREVTKLGDKDGREDTVEAKVGPLPV